MRVILVLILFFHLVPLSGGVIFVSDRLDFIDPDRIAPATLKEREITIPLSPTQSMRPQQWQQEVQGKKVVIHVMIQKLVFVFVDLSSQFLFSLVPCLRAMVTRSEQKF